MKTLARITLVVFSLFWIAVLVACSGTTSTTPKAPNTLTPPAAVPTDPPAISDATAQPADAAETDATQAQAESTQRQTPAPEPPPKTEPKKPRLYGLNETVSVGYTSYKVHKATWTQQIGDHELLRRQANAEFLVLELAVRNDDKKARTIPPFHLIDEYNTEYDVSPEAWAVKGNIGPLDSLNPDVTKQGLIVFDVPRSRKYRLKISGGFWSTEDAFIAITEESDSQRAEREAKASEAQDKLAQAAARKEAIEAAKWRTWTSKAGSHQTEAKFVKSAKGIVTLEKKDGKTIEISMDKLCEDDQEFITRSKWRLAAPK